MQAIPGDICSIGTSVMAVVFVDLTAIVLFDEEGRLSRCVCLYRYSFLGPDFKDQIFSNAQFPRRLRGSREECGRVLIIMNFILDGLLTSKIKFQRKHNPMSLFVICKSEGLQLSALNSKSRDRWCVILMKVVWHRYTVR